MTPKMRALSLFSGIGGLDLAAQRAGIEIVAMCEIEPFCCSILKKRFPNIEIFNDVKELKGGGYESIDIIFGGFPCQDLSTVGTRRGLEGERSGLWFEMERIIHEARPAWVLAENVFGAVNLALDTVRTHLEAEGYQVRAILLSAAAFGAPHLRERIFIVAARQDIFDELELPLIEGDKAIPREKSAIVEPKQEEDIQAKWINPDWAEQFMGFPEGWTNPDIDVPAEWKGWPMTQSEKKRWPTLLASECEMSNCYRGMRPFRNAFLDIKHGAIYKQYDYEPSRFGEYNAINKKRIHALGNAVVPQQVYPLFKAIVEANAMRIISKLMEERA